MGKLFVALFSKKEECDCSKFQQHEPVDTSKAGFSCVRNGTGAARRVAFELTVISDHWDIFGLSQYSFAMITRSKRIMNMIQTNLGAACVRTFMAQGWPSPSATNRAVPAEVEISKHRGAE